jgi:hypothetical protein
MNLTNMGASLWMYFHWQSTLSRALTNPVHYATIEDAMSTLVEIENAAAALSSAEKQELLFFLATRLKTEGKSLPPPRQFTREQVAAWVAEDEAGWKRFQAAQ